LRELLLMFVILSGLTVAGHAQDAGSPAPPTAKPTVSTSAVAPAQPIAFNHKLHVQTAKMGCNDCHEPRGDGSTVAMPQPAKCMVCHSSVAADKPDIQRLAASAKDEDPISWVRVYRVPSFVTFSHKTHAAAGSKCEECHGPVAERTAIALEKDTSMGSCIACHQAKQAPTSCDTCHAIMSKNGHSPFEVDAAALARLQIAAAKPATTVSIPRGSAGGTRQLEAAASFLHVPTL
jgi:Cytochrome c7 and related cytochrome c/Class III cytochrome C family